MAIKIKGVEVISDDQELTGVKFGTDTITFPTGAGNDGQLLSISNNTLYFVSSGLTENPIGSSNYILEGNLNTNNFSIISANNANVIIDPQGIGSTIIDSKLKTQSIYLGYNSSANTAICKLVTATGTSSSTNTFTLSSFDATKIRSMKIVIQASNTTSGYYYVSELLCFHDGTDAYSTEYATMDTTPNSDMITVQPALVNGNFVLRITPSTTDTIDYKFTMQQHTA